MTANEIQAKIDVLYADYKSFQSKYDARHSEIWNQNSLISVEMADGRIKADFLLKDYAAQRDQCWRERERLLKELERVKSLPVKAKECESNKSIYGNDSESPYHAVTLAKK